MSRLPWPPRTHRTLWKRRLSAPARLNALPASWWRWRAASIGISRRCFPAGSTEIRNWTRCAACSWSSDRAALAALQRKLEDPQQFAEAISAVLARAFTLAETRGGARRGSRAGMERAARISIRKDPSTLVGVIHPLVGPAIRRAIAETLDGTLQRLNQAFKHSLSWRGLKWRLEAYRSGSTFAEVVLKHTVVFRVEHLFLIHRKTGLLLEHVAASEAETQDPHMVSGMLTAIQDFARDSFTQNTGDNGGGIDSVRLGDLLLWCEEGPFAFLAAVIRGNPPETLRAVLRDTLPASMPSSAVHSRNSRATPRRWATWRRAQGCAATTGAAAEKRLSPWLWALPLVLLVIAGSWLVRRKVEEYRVGAYVQRLRQRTWHGRHWCRTRERWMADLRAARPAGRRSGQTCWRSPTSIRHASSAIGNRIWR